MCSYIDGELTPEELTALEAFLQQYPAIRQELELLDNVRLQPDEEVVFENRASLYKGIKVDEDITTMMLSYIDNELDITKKKQLQVYLDSHPEAKKELQQFKSAKLDPAERISFGNKQVLYRQQKPVRRIAVWWGAAAAVVAGVLVWTMPFTHPETATKHATLADNVKRNIPAKTSTVLPAHQEPPAAVATVPEPNITAGYNQPVKKTVTSSKKPTENQASDVKKDVLENANTSSGAKSEPQASPQFPPPRNTSQEIVERQVAAIPQPAATLSATAADKPTVKEHVIAANVPVTTDAPPANISRPAEGIKGELIMSVSGSDSKILDKVTNVAKFFSRKRNN
ncbi:hypothetical protein [Chitinophaga sp. Cy-1792]|uniref:hypothetical protein n=1 Tax=Chitinophaga sp. Cy-1792 TaxID=2608339 RepID=UPI001421A8DB|nr:hypothetical protein [Chitinophaga sp. Cy-1792]NIG52238.1 hypothetical protein [Chitinophaga sp. Cy-1792]